MMRRTLHAPAADSLRLAVACADANRRLPVLESAEVVLPARDSATVLLLDGTGAVRDASGTRVVEAGLTDWRAVGDFGQDGASEAIDVVWSSGGGSVTSMELALFALEHGGWMSDDVWRWRASAPLGDRVRVRALTGDREIVEVHLTRHGPGDLSCCPTHEAVLCFVVTGGGVEERSTRGD
jgi:hypothetical protein